VRQIIVKRLSMLVLVLFGVTLITFFLSHVIPGDPARMMVGQRASEETLQEVRRQLGLDQPVWVQYFTYMSGLLAGDFGNSIRTQQPVIDDLITFFPATLELAFTAFVIAIVIGIPIGILSAVKKDTGWDHAGRMFSIAGISTPVFWSGLVGILTASMYDEGTPSHAACSAMHQSGARLLAAAQEAGRVRPDLTADELFDLLSGAAWVRENAQAGRDGTDRFLQMVLEGITVRGE